jgi:hypothetical protein
VPESPAALEITNKYPRFTKADQVKRKKRNGMKGTDMIAAQMGILNFPSCPADETNNRAYKVIPDGEN